MLQGCLRTQTALPFGQLLAALMLLSPKFLLRCVSPCPFVCPAANAPLGLMLPLPSEHHCMYYLQDHWSDTGLQPLCCEEVPLRRNFDRHPPSFLPSHPASLFIQAYCRHSQIRPRLSSWSFFPQGHVIPNHYCSVPPSPYGHDTTEVFHPQPTSLPFAMHIPGTR